MSWKGPLAGRYWAAVALVLVALVPYLALSSAIGPLLPILSPSLHMSMQALSLTDGMANAAYALGTVVALQVAMHFPQRRMLLIYAALFVIGSVLAAAAVTPAMFIVGHILQGLCTSLMLIAAVPPLVIGWPPSRLSTTGVTLSLGIFGAVAGGPVIGGVQAGFNAWRPLFWIVVGVGALALLMAILTFDDQGPADPTARRDPITILLAGTGSAAAFFGASELTTRDWLDPVVIVPLLIGGALVVVLLIHEYVAKNPLISVRKLCTTLPVGSAVIAISAGAAAVAVIELAQNAYTTRGSPTHVGILFLPELGGAVLVSVIFGMFVRSRLLPVFILSGMALLTAGSAVLIGVATGSETVLLVGSGLVGLGVGASVGPALFLTGYTLRPMELQRVYAILELLRGVAAFIVGPILLHVALTASSSPAAGTRLAVGICVAIAGGGALIALLIGILGRFRLHPPDVDRWQQGLTPALHSPPLAYVLRGGGRHEEDDSGTEGRHEAAEGSGRHEVSQAAGRHEA